jgi:periplasmic protein TonB
MSALINKAFDDLVFENRNKTFGAFKLRQGYDKYITGSMLLSATLFFLAISSPVIYKQFAKAEEVVEKVHMVEVNLEDIPPINPNQAPPPPPPKIEMPQLSTVKFLPPVVKPDVDVVEEIPPTVDELKASNAGAKNQEGQLTLDNIIVAKSVNEVIEEEKEEIFTWVAEMPEFKGGDEALIKFLSSRLTYPKEASKNLIEGDVWLEFIVNKDGSLSDFKVLRALGHGCDEEALRVARQMPAWKPAFQNGKAVKLKKKLKITFKFPN